MSRAQEKRVLAEQQARDKSLVKLLVLGVLGIVVLILIALGAHYLLAPPPAPQQPVAGNVGPEEPRIEKAEAFLIEDPSIGMEDEAIQEQRHRLRESWIENADWVANKADDQEAKKVVRFLRENSCLAAPVPIGFQFLEPVEEREHWLAFIALVPGDERKSEQWKKLGQAEGIDRGAVASFAPLTRGLVVKSHVAFSPSWQGIVLLHEGHHACTYIPTPYDWEDAQTFCYKERDTHAFQNRVMQRFGGRRYTSLLKQEVDRMRAELHKDGEEVGTSFPNRTEYNTALDGIFGEAQSEMERDTRQSHFWLHAVFSLIEEDFKGDVEDRKALLLFTIYKESGLLPEQRP